MPRWRSQTPTRQNLSDGILDVEIRDFKRVLDDEVAARFDHVAHQRGEHAVVIKRKIVVLLAPLRLEMLSRRIMGRGRSKRNAGRGARRVEAALKSRSDVCVQTGGLGSIPSRIDASPKGHKLDYGRRFPSIISFSR